MYPYIIIITLFGCKVNRNFVGADVLDGPKGFAYAKKLFCKQVEKT